MSIQKDRVIPLTPPGANWTQREYVECMRLGIGFTAHRYDAIRHLFHYKFPVEHGGCTSVLVGFGEGVLRYIDHTFVPGVHWIDEARRASLAELEPKK